MLKIFLTAIITCQLVQGKVLPYNEEFLRLLPKYSGSMSEECAQFYTKDNADNLLPLLDAGTKIIPSGLLKGNIYDLGHFDACYSWNTNFNQEKVFGKYCLVPTQISLGLPISKNVTFPVDFKQPNARQIQLGIVYISICIPSICKANEVEELYKEFYKLLNVDAFPILDEFYCSPIADGEDLSSGAISTIAIVSVIGMLVLVSTIYEICIFYKGREAHHEVLLAFSAWRNSRKIWVSSKNPDQLSCLNGIRAISMMWVIAGHTFSKLPYYAVDNLIDIQEFRRRNINMYILGGTVSVDTFFAIGGIVTVYSFMKSIDKGTKFNLFLYYLHRYLRLTPALALMVLINGFLANYLGNGPMWYTVDGELGKACREYWWSALLYIQDWVKPGEAICVPQSWYLSVDFKLFLCSPIILYSLLKFPKKMLIALFSLLIALGIIIPALVTWYYGVTLNGTDPEESMLFAKVYYLQTHTRFGPYIIGMLFGYFIYYIKKSNSIVDLKKSRLIATLVWLIVIGGLYGCVFGIGYVEDVNTNAIFINGFNRNAWALTVCLLTVLCVTGYAGPVNIFLSADIFQKLAKISYAMYLVHYTFLSIRYSAWRHPVHFEQKYMWWAFWGDFVIIAVFSFLYCLMFESPMVTLEKLLLGIGGQSKKQAA